MLLRRRLQLGLRYLARNFLNGLILIGPVALTIWLCVAAFRLIDGWLNLPVPGVGFLATIAAITLFGFVASTVFARWAFDLIEQLLTRLPFVRLLYSALRDVFGAFAGDQKRFTIPVLVELIPGSRINVLGFLTQESLDTLGLAGQVAVYLPQSYNFAGQTIVVPAERVRKLDLKPADALAFIVSGGVSMPDVERLST